MECVSILISSLTSNSYFPPISFPPQKGIAFTMLERKLFGKRSTNKNREVEKLKDLGLKQREQIKSLKSAILLLFFYFLKTHFHPLLNFIFHDSFSF